MRVSKEDRDHALEQLRKFLKPGDTVFTILRHVSRSGMQRSIQLLVPVDGDIVDLSYYASCVVGWPLDKDSGGIKVKGCGMDMGAHVVYELAHRLFAGEYNRDSWSVSEPGYGLKHRWI